MNDPDSEWFYGHGEDTIGPFSESQLQTLRSEDVIEEETYVCRRGDENWSRYAEAFPTSQEVSTFGVPSLTSIVRPGSGKRIDQIDTTAPKPQPPKKRKLLGVWTVAISGVIVFLAVVLFRSAFSPPRPLPSRENFQKALAGVQMIAMDRQTLLIQDAKGEKLELRVAGLPRSSDTHTVPDRIELRVRFDPFPLPKEEDSVRAALNKVVQGYEITLGEVPDQQLGKGIETMVEWSIAAVETKTDALTRDISSGKGDMYIFYCDVPSREFRLSLFRSRGDAMFAMGSGQPVQLICPVTTYSRAHLWVYLFKHYDEIRSAAANGFDQIKREAVAVKSHEDQVLEQQQRNEENRQKSEQEESGRIDRVFSRPSPEASQGR